MNFSFPEIINVFHLRVIIERIMELIHGSIESIAYLLNSGTTTITYIPTRDRNGCTSPQE